MWSRSELWVTGYRVTQGVVDVLAVAERSFDGTLTRRGVLEYPGAAVAAAVFDLPVLAGPDRAGWRSVEPSVVVDVQYRLGPSGQIREPRVSG